jgi:hypothetical protein
LIALEEIFAALGPFGIPEGAEVNFVPGIRTAHSLPLQWRVLADHRP